MVAVGFWTVVALVSVLPTVGQSADWHKLLLCSVSQWWSWGLLAPVIALTDRALPFSSRQLTGRVLVQLLLAPVFSMVCAHMWVYIAALIGGLRWPEVTEAKVLLEGLHELFWNVLIYGLIVVVWQAYLYQQRCVAAELNTERLERNFAEAQLAILRTQLDPHFLFNALNTISAQVEHEPRLARQMIEHLGDLLRLSLSTCNRSEVELVEELTFVDHYLAIQKIRFGQRLRVDLDIATDVLHALVPSMVIQPLVENAIRHGLSSRGSGGTVVLSAKAVGDRLHIKVIDDGVGLPVTGLGRTRDGLGLSVTRERIARLHPNEATYFSVHPRVGGGTEVEIQLPLQIARDSDDRRVA
jgi:sensor histidine kinase YesM